MNHRVNYFRRLPFRLILLKVLRGLTFFPQLEDNKENDIEQEGSGLR